MEALGLATSIIAVIQLAGKITSLGYGYISSAKRAPNDIRELLEEISSLAKTLVALKNLELSPGKQLEALHSLDEPLWGCLLELERLESKLKKSVGGLGWRRFMSSIKWPFKEAENLQIMARIERYKSLFIIALGTDHIWLSKMIEGGVQDLKAGFQAESAVQGSWRQSEEVRKIKERRKDVLNWLYPESYDTKHIEISNKRQKDTGIWLLRSRKFQELVGRKAQLLWGYGIPGAGKTFLSSLIIDHFQDKVRAEKLDYGVAYVYFEYQERDRQRPIHILSSLVKQLATGMAQLPKDLEKLYSELEHRDAKPSIQELYAILLSTFKSFDRVFLIFDALDECDQEAQRKELLPIFHRMRTDGASLFITSRQYPEDIQESFRTTPRIELSAQGEDITSYIQERIEENPRAKRLVLQGGCKDRIISEMIDCANGMFLLVRFHIDYLCQQTTAKEILTALETLKSSTSKNRPLDPTYNRVIDTIFQQPESCVELAIQVLTWLFQAKRTLTIGEIQTAVSVKPGRYELEELDLPDRATLLDVCGGLVVVDENSDTIRLAHYTVQEYLLRKSIIPKGAESQLAVACLTYLSFDAFSEGRCSSKPLLDARLELHPFYGYSARHVVDHHKTCDESLTKDSFLRFLERPKNFHSWDQANDYIYNNGRDCDFVFDEIVQETVPLLVACSIGHFLVAQQLLKEGADVSQSGHYGFTAMHLAASEGHEAILQLLIGVDANLSARDSRGRIPLMLAAAVGNESTVQMLLEKDVDLMERGLCGETAVHPAVDLGNKGAVRLLLQVDATGQTALHYAAYCGQEATTRLLLREGANVLDQDEDGQTALHFAASRGHEAVVLLLLQGGTDVLAQDRSGSTALHEAASYGHEAMAALLLQEGADVLGKNKVGHTALHLAVRDGHEAVASLLLQKGANVLEQDSRGATALHIAAYHGYEAITRFLLHEGADILGKDGDGDTVLHYAALRGYEEVVRLLLEKPIDGLIQVTNKYGRTALDYAARERHDGVVRLLRRCLDTE